MLRLLAVLFTLAVSSSAFADDKDRSKPNTLTPKEIADGWLLLFDGESKFGWKIDGAAEVKDGVLVLGRGKKTIAYPTTNVSHFHAECQLQGKATISFGDCQLTVEGSAVANDSNRWTTLAFELDQLPGKAFAGHHIVGGDARQKTQKSPSGPKTASFVIETDGKTEFCIRTIKIRPDRLSSLFTGKNLDGWKINAADPKRMTSKWSVTPAGELSVKNGPGDLVSEKEFDNFVLQFECKTQGKALNSGIFFRCIPGQYQNGYEAQIQNAYKDDDRTKPADFGTGAIYRRIPARRVVSNDNEWFTMTVVANGKHFATWVNGYQTVDWTDERKADENPRKGYRATKGPLSIQGHDPTTDILFRNIRIAELSK